MRKYSVSTAMRHKCPRKSKCIMLILIYITCEDIKISEYIYYLFIRNIYIYTYSVIIIFLYYYKACMFYIVNIDHL